MLGNNNNNNNVFFEFLIEIYNGVKIYKNENVIFFYLGNNFLARFDEDVKDVNYHLIFFSGYLDNNFKKYYEIQYGEFKLENNLENNLEYDKNWLNSKTYFANYKRWFLNKFILDIFDGVDIKNIKQLGLKNEHN